MESFSIILGNIHKLGRLLTHEWWTVVDKEGKSKERYLFLFKARILICKVRRISDDRSVFILKEIVRLPETEVKDSEENKIEFKSADEVIVLIAHKEETKKFWLKEIKQYITDVVALQEHTLDDLKIDPKQHLDTNEPTIKLPTRIEAYEPNQNIKPSDFAEDYTISKYSTTKATEEIKTGTVTSVKETTTSSVVTEETVTKCESSQEKVEVKEHKSVVKETSKIPVLKKSTDEKPAPKVEAEVPKKPEVKPKEEEKPKEETKVEEKPKVLPELKTEIVRKAPVELQSITPPKTVEKPLAKEEEKPKAVEPVTKPEPIKEAEPIKEPQKPIKKEAEPKAPEDPIRSELSEVEASVSEKLDRLSQKLRAIRKTETDKEVTKLVPQEIVKKVEVQKDNEELKKQEAIRESIQEQLDEDFISESSVIKRIEERYKRNYKDKEIKISSRKQSVEESRKSLTPKDEFKVETETKPKKPVLAPLNLSKDEKPTDKEPEITKAADTNKSDSPNQPQQQDQSQNEPSNNQSGSGQDNSDQGSSSSRNNQSGDSRKPNRDRSPPSPGSIRLPGFFDPPPPTQYETSIEVHVKKEKYPDPPPKITRKVVVKNEELEKKTEEFLRGELPYEKEDYSLGSAQKKIKNLKHNLGKTTDTIKFAEDTVSKARVGDFKNIKTPGTVVPERKKEAVFEYQYTVEDPKTGLCITTSQQVDFEEAEEDLTKLAKMDAEHAKTQTKRVEGKKAQEKNFFIIFRKNIFDKL